MVLINVSSTESNCSFFLQECTDLNELQKFKRKDQKDGLGCR